MPAAIENQAGSEVQGAGAVSSRRTDGDRPQVVGSVACAQAQGSA
jgi:hypothetical protein